MKQIYLSLLLLSLLCGYVIAQTPANSIQRLDRDDQAIQVLKRLNGLGETQQFDMDGTPLEVTPMAIPRRLSDPMEPQRKSPGEVISVNGAESFNSVRDARNLPLSKNGRLLTPNGREVEFVLPNNPNDPGICATPTPYVVEDMNLKPMANCPISVPCDQAVNRDANIPTGTQAIKYFQLNWVVVQSTSGGAGSNIDQTRIDQLMSEVNADFAAHRIQFCADPATFVSDDTYYTLNVSTEDAGLKTTYGTTPQNWINVYVVGSITNPSAGGYARFPYDPFGGLNIRGGVVLARGNMFLGTHTLAHELGHTFGLFHTFHGVDEVTPCTNCYEGRDLVGGGSSGGDTEGDWCSDTNPHATNANICGDAGTDGCAPGLAWLNSPVNNHMSYSFCTSQFTNQQAGRMHCMIDTYLGNWVAFGNATCGAQPPTADFSGNPTTWQSPMDVVFTDLSVPTALITTWTWNFDVTGIGGVTPATFVGQNPPTVEYTVCDTQYTVSLTVTGPNGSDTETKVDYITVNCPAGNCDTLYDHWDTPVSNPAVYFLAANDYVSGIPAPTLSGGVLSPLGFYERYITPSPGVTTVGAAELLLTGYLDADSNTVFQVVVYNSDPTGLPVGGPLTGVGGINPGADLAIPNLALDTVWIPFNKTVIDSPSFLVGMEVFPGNTTDELQLVSSTIPEGQAAGLNFTNTNGFGYVNYNTFVGIDFDLYLIPMLGSWRPEPVITGVGAVQGCDTTLVILTDTTFFNECLTSMSFTSSQLGSVSDTTHETLDTLALVYTSAPPDTFFFETINDCNRSFVTTFTLNYPFDTTPIADFVVNTPLPVCAGTPVSFTASPAGATDYFWDFGDGTTASSGGSNTTSHTYATPGTYYVELILTDPSGCFDDELKLDLIDVIDCSVNAPLAGFTANPDTVCIGDTVFFTDNSLAVPDPPTDWFWAFDDGTFSLAQNPNHTYSAGGTYNVQLIAENSGGADTTFRTVFVEDPCILSTDIVLRAVPSGGDVILAWEVPDGFDQSSFQVQRSISGANFQDIAQVDWAQQDAPWKYSHIDASVDLSNTVFYRIKARSLNGENSFSNVERVRLDQMDAWMTVYPNPLGAGNGLNVDIFLHDSDEVIYQLYDALGREILDGEMQLDAGVNSMALNTNWLPAGHYLLKVTNSMGTVVRKIEIR